VTVDQFLVVAGAAKTEISGCPLDKSEGVVKANFSRRCFVTVSFAREVEDQDSGNLTLNHLRWKIVPPTIDSALTSTMILLCEHPAPCGMRERPLNTCGLACADQGQPRAALDANDLWIRHVRA